MAMTSLTHRYLSHTHNGKRMRLKILYRKREGYRIRWRSYEGRGQTQNEALISFIRAIDPEAENFRIA